MTLPIFFDPIAPSRETPGHRTATILPDGRVALLWSEAIDPGNRDDDRLMLQLDAAGDPPPTPVTLDTGDLLYSDAVIAALPDGRLVASWRAYDRVAGVEDDRVVVQVLDANGAAQGQPTSFDRPDGYNSTPLLVADGAGFALIWEDQSYDAATGSFRDVVIRRLAFDAQGAPAGPATEIARLAPEDSARIAEMVTLANGDLAVIWTTTTQDAVVGGYDQVQADTVFARVFTQGGAAVSDVIALSAPDATSFARAQLVALEGGGFAALWQEGFSFQVGQSVAARVFDPDGQPSGPVQRFGTTEYGLIDAVALPGGRVVVAMDDRTYDFGDDGAGTTFNVALRELGPDMLPFGPAERVLRDVGSPGDISLFADGDSRLAISWEEDNGPYVGQSRLDLIDATAFVRLGDGDDSAAMDGSEAGLGAGAGDDTITGSGQGDAILGEAGDDSLSGGAGDDGLAGGAGADTLQGEDGDDILRGEDGHDRLLGAEGADTLSGGDGRDVLNGGMGDDLIFGWQPDGQLRGAYLDLSDTILGMEGRDTIDAGAGNDRIWAGTEDDFVFGGTGADLIVGQAGADTLLGGAGADQIFGGSGDDLIDGGQGFDRIAGGEGADTFYHVSRFSGGSDWIQDYDAAAGDLLATDRDGALAEWYQVNLAATPGAGAADVAEAFVIFRPTGQIVWALVDGAGQDAINLDLGGAVIDLLM
ncbi:calcium-binding protein [Palleronia pelagia]|uniref:Hemolysin-type calcium-binding repeat-containing protein n=1 Tax=Palleronia pelagia TaxID=387096 RepID=A0A1H8AKY5_9RHOB|nr:calcium-binding protein [Palleronia pelagia]SEM71400.1 Hemolysin-type calcium-binding repeat-containing protein [Palleronia pelagia]